MSIAFDQCRVRSACRNFRKKLDSIIYLALQSRGVIDLIHAAGGDEIVYLLDCISMGLGALGKSPELLTALLGDFRCGHDLP